MILVIILLIIFFAFIFFSQENFNVGTTFDIVDGYDRNIPYTYTFAKHKNNLSDNTNSTFYHFYPKNPTKPRLLFENNKIIETQYLSEEYPPYYTNKRVFVKYPDYYTLYTKDKVDYDNISFGPNYTQTELRE